MSSNMHLTNITNDENIIQQDIGISIMLMLVLFAIVSTSSKCGGCCYTALKTEYRKRKLTSLHENLISTSSAICSICLDDYSDTHVNIVQLDCGHIYHKKCIREWLDNNDTCPECRSEV